MKPDDYNFISAIFQGFTAFGALTFGFWQIMINDRLKKLQDYAAITVVPVSNKLQLTNVGKINLYLHKYEIGSDYDSFSKGMLMPVGGSGVPSLLIQIKNFLPNQKMPAKFYLTDELGIKYLSTGEVIVEQTGIIPANQIVQDATGNIQQIQAGATLQFEVKAWTYKMEKYNWKL